MRRLNSSVRSHSKLRSKNGQVIGIISFIVLGIAQFYLDKNPIVEGF
jgi:hypothetical protein